METPGGQFRRMAGILPAIARLSSRPSPVKPVEVTLCRPNWLGEAGTRLRGYLNSLWRFEPTGGLASMVADAQYAYALAGSFHAVGSLLHLNFSAQPGFLRHFFSPEPGANDPLPWTVPSTPS
jgi:hypothetical protein